MSGRIEQLVKESFADQYFEKAKECLQELREQCEKVSNLLKPRTTNFVYRLTDFESP
jgi:hypothetical protein